MNQKYSQDITIACYETDAEQRLTLSALLNYAQDIAGFAADRLGFGYDALITRNYAWILARQHFDILKAPHWKDKVTLLTWHKGIVGPFFIRDFQLVDVNGELLARGTSSWLVLDLENRSLVRNEQIADILPKEPQCTEDAIVEPASKVVIPRSLEQIPVKEHKVVYSDIDSNRHVNNVRYMTWAIDCIDPEITMTRPVKACDINFNKEAHLGDTVTLMRCCSTQEDGTLTYYVQGLVDGKPSFVARILF